MHWFTAVSYFLFLLLRLGSLVELNKSQSCAVCQSFTTNLNFIQFKTDSQIKHKQAPGQSKSRVTGLAIFLLKARPPPLASACKPEHNQTNKTTKSQTGSRHTVSTQPRQVCVHISKCAHLWCADADATSCDAWKADCSAGCQHTHEGFCVCSTVNTTKTQFLPLLNTDSIDWIQ